MNESLLLRKWWLNCVHMKNNGIVLKLLIFATFYINFNWYILAYMWRFTWHPRLLSIINRATSYLLHSRKIRVKKIHHLLLKSSFLNLLANPWSTQEFYLNLNFNICLNPIQSSKMLIVHLPHNDELTPILQTHARVRCPRRAPPYGTTQDTSVQNYS